MKLLHRNAIVFAISGSLCALAGLLASAQEPSRSAEQDTPVFRSEVSVVNLFFNVKDKHGALVPSLAKDDFEVYEEGKPQTIKYFRLAADQPLTLGMLIDTSGSQERVLPMEKEVGS